MTEIPRNEQASSAGSDAPAGQDENLAAIAPTAAPDTPPASNPDAAPRPAKKAVKRLQGKAVSLQSPTPWPDPVDLGELIAALAAYIRRHVVMPECSAMICAFWVVHTYVFHVFRHTPRLAIASPEKGCGKSTLLDVLELLSNRPAKTANITPAAMFRLVEKEKPTLLVDEFDSFGTGNELLRNVLNAGHRRGEMVYRTVGEDFDVHGFDVFAPVAIAAIGRLPATVADRSLFIRLQRKLPAEKVENLTLKNEEEGRDLARKCARWAIDHGAALARIDPAIPAILHNRAADNWRPFLAIAEAAGGDWPARLRKCVASGASVADDSDGIVGGLLLADIKEAFGAFGWDRVATEKLLGYLNGLESRPWRTLNGGTGLSAHDLATLLKPYGIAPKTIKIGKTTAKGYLQAAFYEVFQRYVADT